MSRRRLLGLLLMTLLAMGTGETRPGPGPERLGCQAQERQAAGNAAPKPPKLDPGRAGRVPSLSARPEQPGGDPDRLRYRGDDHLRLVQRCRQPGRRVVARRGQGPEPSDRRAVHHQYHRPGQGFHAGRSHRADHLPGRPDLRRRPLGAGGSVEHGRRGESRGRDSAQRQGDRSWGWTASGAAPRSRSTGWSIRPTRSTPATPPPAPSGRRRSTRTASRERGSGSPSAWSCRPRPESRSVWSPPRTAAPA